MIAKQKTATLCAYYLVKTWLQDLKVSSSSPKATTKQFIFVKYHCFINIELTEWTISKQGTLLVKWEDFIYQVKQFNIILKNLLTNIGSI